MTREMSLPQVNLRGKMTARGVSWPLPWPRRTDIRTESAERTPKTVYMHADQSCPRSCVSADSRSFPI